jgi:undecaprenyl-diphosphatase
VALAVLVLLARTFPTALAGVEIDLVEAFTRLPLWLDAAIIVVLQLLTLVAQIGLIVFLLRKPRRRLALTALVAAIASGLLFAVLDRWLARPAPEALAAELPGPLFQGEAWPSTTWLAAVAAVLVVANTMMTRRWRVATWALYATLLAVRVVTGTTLALDIAAAAALGIAIGSVTLLALGRPDVSPTLDDVSRALDAIGLRRAVVTPAAVDARGSTPYFVQADGRRVFAKVLTSQERYADLIFRTYRRIRFRELGDERPFSSLRRAVEHEALLSLMARDLEVQTPRLVGIAQVGDFDALLLAFEAIDGKSLDALPSERISDSVLHDAWEAIARLHERQIAHRDLRLANVFLDEANQVWMIDFGFGEAACSPVQKSADIAEFLASSAAVVGSERAVAAAAAVLGTEELIGASSRLQPLALSTATRNAVKSLEGGLDGLRSEVSRVAGAPADEPVELERVRARTLVTLVIIGAAVYFLVPQLADLPGLFRQIRDVEVQWIVPVIIASLATYAGAALGLACAIAQRVPYLPALGVSLAGSFVNRLAPVKVAGAALNIRFLQKRGTDPLTAIAGVGLIAMAGGISHIVVTSVSLLAAGQQQDGLPFTLPDTNLILLGAAAILILVGVVLWVPRTAQLVKDKVVPALVSTKENLKSLAGTPRKIVGLFVGGMLVPVSYSLCLYFSVEAFGGGLSVAQVAVVFLTIGTIASAAPTPGGVGAVEAALIGGLTAIGIDPQQALASVFFYRLATFWIPVLPGWGAFTLLQRSEAI